MFSSDQFKQAQSLFDAHFEAQFHSYKHYTQAMLQSSTSVLDLHLDTIKTALATATVASSQLMSVKDPQDWFPLALSQSQHALDRAQAYSRQAAGIASGAHALLTEAAAPLQGFFHRAAQ